MDPRVLHQTWRHSHEEDQAPSLVFRPGTYAFPPSRGRYGFTLTGNGRMESLGPAPSDQDEHRTGGRWQIEDDSTLVLHEPGAPPRRFVIETATRDRLVLRPSD